MESIVESRVMRGLWLFISYCEAYYEDCYLVKRCHLNLSLIIEIFQNIINNSVKAKHRLNFSSQRQSMLPHTQSYMLAPEDTHHSAAALSRGGPAYARSLTGSSCAGEHYHTGVGPGGAATCSEELSLLSENKKLKHLSSEEQRNTLDCVFAALE